MRRKVKRYPEELAIRIATEFLTTDISIRSLQKKYGFKGVGTVYTWIRKFGLSSPTDDTIKVTGIMKEEKAKSPQERALEKRLEELEKQLEYQKLKAKAYEKMIEIAEREFSISIRKKHGSKQ